MEVISRRDVGRLRMKWAVSYTHLDVYKRQVEYLKSVDTLYGFHKKQTDRE